MSVAETPGRLEASVADVKSCPVAQPIGIESSMRIIPPRVRQYIEEEAAAAGLSRDEVMSKSKRRPLAYARRRVAMRLSDDGFGNGQIARWLGLDRSTVQYYMEGGFPPRVRG